jgi:hypothetical protein
MLDPNFVLSEFDLGIFRLAFIRRKIIPEMHTDTFIPFQSALDDNICNIQAPFQLKRFK